MDNLEQQLASVMNNPAMMQQIMAMAQRFGQSASQEASAAEQDPSLPGGMDMSILQKLSGFAQKTGIDSNQQALLQALRPYISNSRVQKLERAMRAAKMAGFATTLIGR